MKRITISTYIFILSLLFINPSLAESNKAEQLNSNLNQVSEAETEPVIASETFLSQKEVVEPATEESESISSNIAETNEGKEEEETLEEEDDTEPAPKAIEEKPKNNWLEKSTGKQLNNLKTRLENLQDLYNINYRAFRIGDAINSFEKADSQKKRNNALMLDITKQQTFSIYASTYVFPELLKTNIEKSNSILLNIEKELTDEIKDTTEEVDSLINKISDILKRYESIHKAYDNFTEKTARILKNLEKTNSRANDLTKFGYYIKNTNKTIIDLISTELSSLMELVEQLKFSIEYSKEQIKYINTHNHSIAVKCKYIAEIRSSFKDYEKVIESFETKQEYNFHLLLTQYTKRYDEIKSLIGTEEIREGHIKKHIKNSKYFPESKKVALFNATEDLTKIFELFELSEIDSELYEQLLVYISDKDWYCRYKEEETDENKKETDKTDKTNKNKKKPKLIDFEEDM